jgi:hypothetical protein
MFDVKQKAAAPVQAARVVGNAFIAQGKKMGAQVLSQNGAKKFNTSGDPLVDQLKSCGSYIAPRKFKDVATDMSILWAHNATQAVQFTGYLRAVQRNTVHEGKTVGMVNGEGLKNEAILRMIWLAVNHPETFNKNLKAFIALGSWKDVFTMLVTDLSYNGWDGRVLNWQFIISTILDGLQDDGQTNLIRKYLPSIKAKSKCTTIEAQAKNLIAKYICSALFGVKEDPTGKTYKQYRQLKAAGTAHQWQQLISQGKFQEIDFDKIHGKALSILVKSKTFLKGTGLSDKFSEFISSKVKSGQSVKTTDFVFDVLAPLQGGRQPNPEIRDLIIAQFEALKNKCEENPFPWIVVRDTSGSMGCMATGLTVTANHVAKSLALLFSEFLIGTFQNSWIEFNHSAILHEWQGSNVVEKYLNDRTSCISSTDYQKVIDLFINLKNQGVPESHFPKGIICISDGEFNRAGITTTNFDVAKNKLSAFFSEEFVEEFKFVFWDVASPVNQTKKFETYGPTRNVYYFGGFSPAVIKFVNSADDAVVAASNCLDQPIIRDMEV